LNLRPPGYEPGELPDCSTPRRDGKDSIGFMPWWTWTALAIFVLVVCVGIAVSFAAFLQMRRLSTAGKDVARALEEVATKTDALEARLEHAEQRAALVERKMAQLQASFERLSVLNWALGDVRRTVSGITDAITLRK
jgi:Flp pilus assembly protein TadG